MMQLQSTEGAMHALVIGVSSYPNAKGPEVASIKGPAISAARFAEWLQKEFRHPTVRLDSLRTLLSPLPGDEERVASEAAGEVHGRADRDTVEKEMKEWAKRCDRSPHDVAVLYVAGHGTDKPLRGAHLVLEGFSEDTGLAHTVDLSFTFDAMEARAAHLNLFFVDSCRTTIFEQQYLAGARGQRPIELGTNATRRRRSLKVFYGAAPDVRAWTLPSAEVLSDGTLFARALRLALNRAADLDDDGRLCVTANALVEKIAKVIETTAASYKDELVGMADGTGSVRNVPVHYPKVVPVELEIEVVPPECAATSDPSLYRRTGATGWARDFSADFASHPWTITLDAGNYQLRLVSVPAPPPGFDMAVEKFILPEVKRWQVKVEYDP